MEQARWPFIVYQYARNKYMESLDQCKYAQDKPINNWCNDTHTCMINVGIHKYWDDDHVDSAGDFNKMIVKIIHSKAASYEHIDY